MIWAVQASRRTSPAVSLSAGPSSAVPRSLRSVVEGDRDDQGGGVAAVGGQPLRVDGLEQGAERLAALAVDRDPVALPGASVPR